MVKNEVSLAHPKEFSTWEKHMNKWGT
jgi:isopenicillin N synthase-like dioxygenase